MLDWLLFWKKFRTPKRAAPAKPAAERGAVLVRDNQQKNTATRAAPPGDEITNALERLIRLLSNRDPGARRDAAAELGRLGEKAAAAIPALIKAAVGRDAGVRQAA